LDDISYIGGEISPHIYVEIDASDIFVNELNQRYVTENIIRNIIRKIYILIRLIYILIETKVFFF
jgi:hypothetical protein